MSMQPLEQDVIASGNSDKLPLRPNAVSSGPGEAGNNKPVQGTERQNIQISSSSEVS